MVFWNPKKRRTTVKPKTTASISKPKVGSVKQELNILPQPKKTDNPKPNKVPKNEDVKKQFLKTFNQLTYRHRSWDVWRDFIIMFACSLSNPVDKFHYEEREKRYLKIIKKYNKREQEQFPELAAYVVMALEEPTFYCSYSSSSFLIVITVIANPPKRKETLNKMPPVICLFLLVSRT